MRLTYSIFAVLVVVSMSAFAADWNRFRGPSGNGISDETNLPVTWTESDIVWKVDMPGPGASSPIVVGDNIYVTCYTGYGISENAGDQQDLMRHLLCIDRAKGSVRWQKDFKPLLPEHPYEGEGAYHGYAASTPISDGERLYVFFGKSGVFCFDLDGNVLWEKSVGDGINGWGSATSPILFNDLLIINASIESNSLVALNKNNGDEIWKAGGINASWNTPALVKVPDGGMELVVSVQGRLKAFDPNTGDPLWDADGIHRYVCPSVVAERGVVYATGGGHTTLAVRAGGRGDVTQTHTLWRKSGGSNVPSPIYYEGKLYWASDSGGLFVCQDAQTGEDIFQARVKPDVDRVWASPLLADGKFYIASQFGGVYVIAASPKFEQLAHNMLDDARTNASPIAHDGQLLLRNDRYLYCIGEK